MIPLTGYDLNILELGATIAFGCIASLPFLKNPVFLPVNKF